ncbi:hypothetical protein ABH945_003732 [Paraburkholderia sp. GAS333]
MKGLLRAFHQVVMIFDPVGAVRSAATFTSDALAKKTTRAQLTSFLMRLQ